MDFFFNGLACSLFVVCCSFRGWDAWGIGGRGVWRDHGDFLMPAGEVNGGI